VHDQNCVTQNALFENDVLKIKTCYEPHKKINQNFVG
jgi:hypothetical protein